MRYREEFERLWIDCGPGTGIFMMDFSAYFPYADQDGLKLGASLSTGPRMTGDVINLTARGLSVGPGVRILLSLHTIICPYGVRHPMFL